MKTFFKYLRIFNENHHHLWILLYFAFYLAWFHGVETEKQTNIHIIHVPLDDLIPFCEWFIIPYLLWFVYVAFGLIHTAFFNKEEFYKLCCFLYIGMTIFLIISTIYPNGQHIRPRSFERDNIAVQLCRWIYSIDTSTNIFPSIHVYNSIAVHSCIMHCKEFKDNQGIRAGSLILCISIILSTMFIKQHSVCDVCTALLLGAVVHQILYGPNAIHIPTGSHTRRRVSTENLRHV